jgi:hypothetical protein
MKIKALREIAFSRAGDKGDTSNVSVIPYNEVDFEIVKEQVTVEKVKKAYGELVKGDITRYELPGIKALNFVMEKALGGGVSRTLCLDLHGKSRGSIMGSIEIEIPD